MFIHEVEIGDTLQCISILYYGTVQFWKDIYKKNKDTIGSNPDIIRPGQKIVLPWDKEDSI